VKPLNLTLILAASLIASGAACEKRGGTYDPRNCPASPFPAVSDLQRELAMGPLNFYFTNIMSGSSLFKFETWADQKFDYETSLNYYYDDENYLEQRCPRAVILRLKIPFNPARADGAKRFNELLGRIYSKPGVLPPSLIESTGKKSFFSGSSVTSLSPSHLIELGGFHHPARGDFAELGWYEKRYFDENFAAPQEELGRRKK
jgi:hypothetical protein